MKLFVLKEAFVIPKRSDEAVAGFCFFLITDLAYPVDKQGVATAAIIKLFKKSRRVFIVLVV